jgi:nitrogen regulatory protein PII
MGDADKVLKFAKKYNAKSGCVIIGMGTRKHRLLEFLGLNEVRKEIVTFLVEREAASGAIAGIGKDMEFEKPNHGIAFSYSVSEVIDGGKTTCNASAGAEKEKSMFQIIYVIVDKGKAEDVMDAANKAGSRGGTIINARSAEDSEEQHFLPWKSGSNKEEVFIITKNEFKDQIVESIRSHLKIDEPGHGLLFVMDVDEVYGLH